jgi:hypothetical protein
MTVNDEIDAQIAKIRQETSKLIKDIETFDIETSSPDDLNDLFKTIDRLKLEVEDKINELEVEDFLLNGAGIKNKNI